MGKNNKNSNRKQARSPAPPNLINQEQGPDGVAAQAAPVVEPYTFKQILQKNREPFFARMLSGGIVAAFLLLLSHWKGGESASHEFAMHALFIHPLFWVLPMCAFCLYVVAAKTEGERVLRWTLLPLLRFAEHLFGIAFGACIVIATAEISVLDKTAIVKAALILLAILWYFLFAALYTVAAQATEDISRAGRTNAKIFWAYVVMLALSLIFLFGEILPKDPSAKDIATNVADKVESSLK